VECRSLQVSEHAGRAKRKKRGIVKPVVLGSVAKYYSLLFKQTSKPGMFNFLFFELPHPLKRCIQIFSSHCEITMTRITARLAADRPCLDTMTDRTSSSILKYCGDLPVFSSSILREIVADNLCVTVQELSQFRHPALFPVLRPVRRF